VGTGAIFLKLYNGIVVGQQGEGFVAGKYFSEPIAQSLKSKSLSNIIQDISPLLPPLINPVCTKNIRTDSAML
jgi:hypothetical protein